MKASAATESAAGCFHPAHGAEISTSGSFRFSVVKGMDAKFAAERKSVYLACSILPP
jgi:hypothetical protein